MAGVSSIDCVSPAFTLTRKRLFEPFRFGYWSRIAILGVLAGELSSGGNGGGGGGHSGGTYNPAGGHGINPAWIAQHWNLILGVAAAVIVVALLFFYIGSVLRFVLYEAVLRDKAQLREGFMRWRDQGLEYFTFRLTIVLPFIALAMYLIGLPVIKVIRAGGGGPELLTAIAQLAGALLVVTLLGILLAIVLVMTKDFVVPQMMFEGVSCTEGWRRLWRQIQAEPMSYVGYLLLKIVLAIGAFILFVIVMIVAALIAIIPAGIAVAIGVMIFKAVGGGALAIAIMVLLALLIAVPVATYCIGFVGAPISVFFPAYSIYFFGSRYAPLYNELYPQPPSGTP